MIVTQEWSKVSLQHLLGHDNKYMAKYTLQSIDRAICICKYSIYRAQQ